MPHVSNRKAEDLITEDQRAKDQLGPQGVPGKPDTHPQPSPQEKKQMPKDGEFDGHPA